MLFGLVYERNKFDTTALGFKPTLIYSHVSPTKLNGFTSK